MPIEIQDLGLGSMTEWDEYITRKNVSNPYMYGTFRDLITETFGHDPHYLVGRRNGIISGAIPIFFMKSVFFGKLMSTLPFLTYGGIVADDEFCERELVERGVALARENDARFWLIRQAPNYSPERSSGFKDFYQKNEKVTFLLDLPSNADKLLASFPSKLRSQIRKTEKNGVVCRVGGVEEVAAFFSVYSRNMRDLGTPTYPITFFRNILNRWKESCIVTAWFGEVPVGGAFLVGWQRKIEIPWASTDRRYNHLATNMGLYFAAMKYAIGSGYRVMDFGRCTPEEGTYQFKAQWGGQQSPLYWQYWTPSGIPPVVNQRDTRFTFLVNCWKKLPLGISRILGPRIIRDIP